MKRDLVRTLGSWIETGRSVGFFLLLVAGTGLLGFCIAWPLWFYSTTSPRAYTATVLGIVGAGIIGLIVRASRRRQRYAQDPSQTSAGLLVVVLSVLLACTGIAGAFTAAAFFARRMWLWGALDVTLWVSILWLLGKARRAIKGRKASAVHAENRIE